MNIFKTGLVLGSGASRGWHVGHGAASGCGHPIHSVARCGASTFVARSSPRVAASTALEKVLSWTADSLHFQT